MVRSARPAVTGVIRGEQLAADSRRSASSGSRLPASGRLSRCSSTPRALTADSTAAALPRLREWLTTIAPAAPAYAAVWSVLPSSQTMTRLIPGRARAAGTVAAVRCSSSLAGITHATRARAALTWPSVVPVDSQNLPPADLALAAPRVTTSDGGSLAADSGDP